MRPGADPPDVGPPDVEPGRFANIMSAQGDHALERFTALQPSADSTAESPCGAPPQTLCTTLLSVAATCEAPQVGKLLQTVVANFTLGVIQGI